MGNIECAVMQGTLEFLPLMSVMPTFKEVMLNSHGCGYVTPRAVGGVSTIDVKEMFVKAYVSSA